MKLHVITMAYNEEFLLPFFLKHYGELTDNIHVIVDTDSTDKTLEIAGNHPHVTLRSFTFPDGMDDILKAAEYTRVYQEVGQSLESNDWILVVDVDEFVFAFHPTLHSLSLPYWLQHQVIFSPVVQVGFYQVYRNHIEEDLTLNRPVIYQRRFGDSRLGYSFGQPLFVKPILVRSKLDIAWEPGCHFLRYPLQTNSTIPPIPPLWYGTHWAMADPCFVVERRIFNRRNRQSAVNIKLKLAYQHHEITANELLAECAAHLNDPQIF